MHNKITSNNSEHSEQNNSTKITVPNVPIRLRHLRGKRKIVKSLVVCREDITNVQNAQLQIIAKNRTLDWTSETVLRDIKNFKDIDQYINTNMVLGSRSEITSQPILAADITFKYHNCGNGKKNNGLSIEQKTYVIKMNYQIVLKVLIIQYI